MTDLRHADTSSMAAEPSVGAARDSGDPSFVVMPTPAARELRRRLGPIAWVALEELLADADRAGRGNSGEDECASPRGPAGHRQGGGSGGAAAPGGGRRRRSDRAVTGPGWDVRRGRLPHKRGCAAGRHRRGPAAGAVGADQAVSWGRRRPAVAVRPRRREPDMTRRRSRADGAGVEVDTAARQAEDPRGRRTDASTAGARDAASARAGISGARGTAGPRTDRHWHPAVPGARVAVPAARRLAGGGSC